VLKFKTASKLDNIDTEYVQLQATGASIWKQTSGRTINSVQAACISRAARSHFFESILVLLKSLPNKSSCLFFIATFSSKTVQQPFLN
jgi:hypothetical protein